MNDQDRAFFGRGEGSNRIRIIDNMWAVFGHSCAAEPDELVRLLHADEAIQQAETILLTIPNQLGVAYDTHVVDAILTQVPTALGWR